MTLGGQAPIHTLSPHSEPGAWLGPDPHTGPELLVPRETHVAALGGHNSHRGHSLHAPT